MGGYIGLDYTAVDVVLKHSNPSDPAALFADLRVMERAALPILNAPPATRG